MRSIINLSVALHKVEASKPMAIYRGKNQPQMPRKKSLKTSQRRKTLTSIRVRSIKRIFTVMMTFLGTCCERFLPKKKAEQREKKTEL